MLKVLAHSSIRQTNIPCIVSCHLVSNTRSSPKNGIIGVSIIVVLIIHTLVVVDPEIQIDIDLLIVDIN